MEVSGRKVSDSHGSVSTGSAEDFNYNCEPCLAMNQHIEAYGLCVDCQEYLCKNCFVYHQRIKATKYHQLLDKDNMDNHSMTIKDSTVCTEKCEIHKNEIIKFFCTNHEFLGCTDCITLDHRTCKIDYIPDNCTGIGNSDEYNEIMRQLEQKMKDMDDVIKKAAHQEKEIDYSHDHVITEILNFRKEINDRLDQMQLRIQSNAAKMKLKDKQTVTQVIEACSAVTSDIKKYKSSLQDNKTSQQNGQLYIMMKRAKAKLKLHDVKPVQECLENTSIQYTFERNKDLQSVLTKGDIFGKLSLSTPLGMAGKKKVFDNLTHIADIYVETVSDEDACCVTGCAVVSTNKLLLADYKNKKLKVVDTRSRFVIQEKSLDTHPWGIAVLPRNQIAVSLQDKKEILIMTTACKLSVIRRIPIKGECRGITYQQGQLYVVCVIPLSVIILNSEGNAKNTISLNDEIFASPDFILLSENTRHIYISDHKRNSVVSLTNQGDISAVYKHEDLKGPQEMIILEDGSLLVCCYWKGTVHRISGDLKKGQIILDGIQDPQSMCYNQQEENVYIGGYCDHLKEIKIAWKE